jgi:transcriptional regulator with XRE-family HTH domain
MSWGPIDEALVERIKEARQRAGLTQRQVVEDTDYSSAYLSRIEAAARMPSMRFLRAIAPALGVSVRWLETGRDEIEIAIPEDEARILLEELQIVYAATFEGTIAALEEALGVRDEAVVGLA